MATIQDLSSSLLVAFYLLLRRAGRKRVLAHWFTALVYGSGSRTGSRLWFLHWFTALVPALVHGSGSCTGSRLWFTHWFTALVHALVHGSGSCTGSRLWFLHWFTAPPGRSLGVFKRLGRGITETLFFLLSVIRSGTEMEDDSV
ncbi:hypothetical protein ACOMHN_001053 [Nucella lapillus]